MLLLVIFRKVFFLSTELTLTASVRVILNVHFVTAHPILQVTSINLSSLKDLFNEG